MRELVTPKQGAFRTEFGQNRRDSLVRIISRTFDHGARLLRRLGRGGDYLGRHDFRCFGNMETRCCDQTYALFFNKRLAERYIDGQQKVADIIFNNIEYDFTRIYAGLFTTHYGPGFLMRDCTVNRLHISSKWAMAVNYYREIMGNVASSLT